MYIGVSRSLRTQCELCFHDSHSDLGNHAEVADALIPPLRMFIYCWSNQRLLLCSVWACICVFVLLRMCFMRMIPLSFFFIYLYMLMCVRNVRMCTLLCFLLCVCVYIYLCIRISVYSFLFVCIRVRVYICVCLFVYVRVSRQLKQPAVTLTRHRQALELSLPSSSLILCP